MLSALRQWFHRDSPAEPAPVDLLAAAIGPIEPDPAPAAAKSPWPVERMWVNDALWGDGYVFPGGEIETLRLAKPLGLSAASSVLLIGAGAGGPACSITTHFGAWVSGYEADPDLAVIATERVLRANLARRVQVETWEPAEPDFPRNYFHHAMVLEGMRGAQPESFLAAVTSAMKPNGQLVMLDLVAGAPLSADDPFVAAWARLERRVSLVLPNERAITRVMGRLGYDVRIVEDLSQRHVHQAMIGWRRMVQGLEANKPTHRQAAQIVAEAELWLMRLRLISDGRLRLIRWHAMG
ncbi:MAG: hypothetical protein BGO51_14655 [Rhodospirillales bacterium 69-11]|nr:hypothetical protein [Rhodospirillales bacterium]OJW26626.1 MAG: hypothetical protein BGO51_14655 [Rhodospirillales bacterium 69-11]